MFFFGVLDGFEFCWGFGIGSFLCFLILLACQMVVFKAFLLFYLFFGLSNGCFLGCSMLFLGDFWVFCVLLGMERFGVRGVVLLWYIGLFLFLIWSFYCHSFLGFFRYLLYLWPFCVVFEIFCFRGKHPAGKRKASVKCHV